MANENNLMQEWEQKVATVSLITGEAYIQAATKVFNDKTFNPLQNFFNPTELKHITQFLDHTPHGLLLVVGEQGSGKTRMLNFLMKHLHDNNQKLTVLEQIREINLKLWLKHVHERSLGAKNNSMTIEQMYKVATGMYTPLIVQSARDEIFDTKFFMEGSQNIKTLTPVRTNPTNLTYVMQNFFEPTIFVQHPHIIIQQQKIIVKQTGLPYVLHAVIPCTAPIITHFCNNEVEAATQMVNKLGVQTLQQKIDTLKEKNIIEN